MADNPKREGQGTFAQLYDVQEQLSRRNAKPLGRPPKKVQRKPTTVHLTKTETRNLNKLQLLVGEQFTVNRSELVGIAIDVLTLLMEEKGKNLAVNSEIKDVEAFRQYLYDFVKS
ncbi:MAG: hypothetical protein U0401_33135 [Anaerolineae bacterium]